MKFQATALLLIAAAGLSEAGTFIEDATANGNYDTLLGLVNATTGVLDAITANAPVTVFGPQDPAFAAISDVTANLTETELAGVLAGHVVAGEYRAADVIAAGCVELETLQQGTMLKVSYTEADGVMVNDAKVVEADIGDADSIGVLHGVDAVILGGFSPCPQPSTMSPTASPVDESTMSPTTSPVDEPTSFIDAAAATGNYGTLLGLVNQIPGISDTITAVAPVTVFGPQDPAFAAISDVTATLTDTELAGVLAGHVVAGEFRAADVIAAGCVELQTLQPGTMLKVSYMEGMGVMVNNAHVVEPDIGDTDSIGVLHGVDAVILDGFSPCPSPSPSSHDHSSHDSDEDSANVLAVKLLAAASLCLSLLLV